MKTSNLKWMLPVLLTSLLAVSCEKDKEEPNEEELITTVTLNFTEIGGPGTGTFIFRDLDGDGGNPPTVFQDIVLAPNKSYNMTVTLTNESVSPAEDITAEVVAEAGDHQFYFEPTGANVTVNNLNTDPGGLPLGTSARWTTGAASNGNVKITLKHKPGIKAAGDPVTKGETDIELNWVTRVQ